MRKGILKSWKVRMMFFALVVVWIGVLTLFVGSRFVKEKVKISEVFTVNDTKTSGSSIELTGKYIRRRFSNTDKEEVLRYIADAVGLETSEGFQHVSKDTTSTVMIHRISKEADTMIKMISVQMNAGEEIPVIDNYIFVRMEVFDNVDCIMNYKKIIEKAFRDLEINNESCYIKFVGKYQGKLTLEGRNKIADSMIKSLGGRIAYENRQEDMYTVYAYSGRIGEYIRVGKSKVNIQVAMSYNELTDETQVYLASPIMNDSY